MVLLHPKNIILITLKPSKKLFSKNGANPLTKKSVPFYVTITPWFKAGTKLSRSLLIVFLKYNILLKNLFPIFTTPDQQDTELQHAFFIKLRPPIAKHLVSRDFDLTSLQSVIDTAERYDSQFPSSIPSNRAMYADPFREDKAMLKSPSRIPVWYFEHFTSKMFFLWKNCTFEERLQIKPTWTF